MAPYLFERFQKSANNMIGPKVAPNPAQAKETMVKILLSGSAAKNIAIMEMTITEHLATITLVLSDNVTPKTPSIMFSVTLEDAASNCESAVDMVEARIPAKIIPASRAKRKPF